MGVLTTRVNDSAIPFTNINNHNIQTLHAIGCRSMRKNLGAFYAVFFDERVVDV